MTTEERLKLEEKVIELLRTVFDPEIPVDIYSLGLVYKIDINDDAELNIDMTMTAPNCPMADFIVDDTHITPDTKVTQENLLEDVQKMLSQLSDKEKDVLIMRYGLDNNGQKKTLDEIGTRYGVSRERIRQIETRAIAKLKKICRNKNLSVNLKNYIGLE